MSNLRGGTGLGVDIRRAWALVGARERKRLRLIAAFGVLISGLDAFALVLLYALVSLLNNQGTSGVAGRAIGILHMGGSNRYRTVLIVLAITAGLFIVRSALSVLGLWLALGTSYEAEANLIRRFLRGHAHASQTIRLERNSAETLRTLGAVDGVMLGVVFSSVSLVSNAAISIAVAIGLAVSSPVVALTVTVYFAVIAFAWTRLVRSGLAQRGLRVQELQKDRYRLVMQGLAAAKELQLRGRALFYADGAIDRTLGINSAMRVAYVASGSLRYMLETSLVIGAVLVVAAADLAGGRNSVLPAVGLVLAGAFRLLPALNQLLFLANQVQYNGPAIAIVERELATFDGVVETPSPVLSDEPPLLFQKGLELQDVHFSYPTRGEPALRGVSFVLHPGESLAVVGPTGSGKSTLLDMALGIVDPDSGSVTVDGVALAERRQRWQRSIGYVPQDVYLADETLRDNVALGWTGDDVDDARVEEAIRLAQLEDVIALLPHGLRTMVGERGVRLSGGQRQRVGLARALYTRPAVLALDEATSNLDQATEHRIVETLSTLRGGITMIVVTHRVASAQFCDRVVYLEQGLVRAIGTFDEVRSTVPEFGGPSPSLKLAGAG